MIRKSRLLGLVCLSMVLAIILGALGAHKLKDMLSVEKLASFQTGVLYHLIQTLALLALISNPEFTKLKFSRISTIFLGLGTLLFSGSIYLLTTSELSGLVGFNFILGPLTPLGGLLMIAGWSLLAASFAFYPLEKNRR